MTSRVRLAVGIPQTFASGPIEIRRVREFATRAEALGFESLWVVEQILGSIPSLEPIELLSYVAAVTERTGLGTAVLLTALRSPVHVAKSLATLDHLSRGRLLVGVGLGANPNIYPAYGFTAERRVARFVEGLEVMRRLWTEPRVTFQGAFWQLENAAMEPKPVQRPHPPLWFGAHHANALRRAVERAAGFMGAGSATTAAFAEEVKLLRARLAEAGRDPATLDVGKRVYIAVDRDRARAGRRLAEWFGAFYGRPQMGEQVSVFGHVDECLDGLHAILAAGARLLMLHPVFDELEHLEIFAAELAPKL
jgi:probable F420-dependent oxidoreductase